MHRKWKQFSWERIKKGGGRKYPVAAGCFVKHQCSNDVFSMLKFWGENIFKMQGKNHHITIHILWMLALSTV